MKNKLYQKRLILKSSLVILSSLVMMLGLFVVSPQAVQGACNSVASCTAEKAALQNSINAQKQAQAQAQAVQSQLQTEVNSINTTIQQTQNTITKINNDINNTAKSIDDVTNQINTKTTEIAAEKIKLEEALNNMYIDSETYSPLLALAQESISASISTQQNYQAIENSIQSKADEIDALKKQLEQQRTDLQTKQSNLQQMQSSQIQQKNALSGQMNLKSSLLSNTISSISQLQSTITQYKTQLNAVDGRISDFIAAMNSAGKYTAASGDLVVLNSQPWHFFQTDSRWANRSLNPNYSNSDTFAESGCLVTSISMVANYYGVGGTPPDILSKLISGGAMYGDLVSWGGVSGAFGGRLGFTYGKERISWGVVDSYVKLGKPIIVHVAGGNYGHWIVISGKSGDKYSVEDPYFSSGQAYPSSKIDYMARLQP
ncbi:MAG: C39 family peptidase [Patescibacteria group bacterium]|jgi:peptidoglycan hydrolase CwlO-like protein